MAPLVNILSDARPLRADARRNRERILEAARVAFGERGIEAQMDDVAASAKVGVGTVYRHFPTKETLLVALLATRFESFAQFAREALDVEDPWEAFAGYLRRCAELTATDAGVRHALERAPELLDFCPAEKAGLVEANAAVIERARKAGVVTDTTTPMDVPLVMAAVSGAMDKPGKDWRRLLDIILAGMRA